MMNFCRLPPESDPAIAPGPCALTAKAAITSPVKALAAPARISPPLTMPSRLRAVRTLFSLRVKSPTAAWPFRSSGTAHSPSLRRPLVRNCPIG